MKTIAQEPCGSRLPHDRETRIHAVRRAVESGWPRKKICGYYHISRATLWRWVGRYDGTEESLLPLSHRPKSEHPAKKGPEFARKAVALRRRNPGDSTVDIWVKCRMAGLSMCYRTCLRILRREGFCEPYRTNLKRKHDRPYQTPPYPGDKWQMDVKFVPKECRAPGLEGKFYQYTVLDEASRRRYLRFSDEHSMREAAIAFREAVRFFGYAPRVLQTDNGTEFSDRAFRKEGAPGARAWPNALEAELARHGTVQKFIRPRTPEHNGKVERSHRIDQEKFYRTLSFHSLEDLRRQGAAWLRRYNSRPRPVLGMMSPDEAEVAKLRELYENEGEVRCRRLLRRFTSSVT